MIACLPHLIQSMIHAMKQKMEKNLTKKFDLEMQTASSSEKLKKEKRKKAGKYIMTEFFPFAWQTFFSGIKKPVRGIWIHWPHKNCNKKGVAQARATNLKRMLRKTEVI